MFFDNQKKSSLTNDSKLIRFWLHFFICNRKPGDCLDNLETSDAKSPRENEHIIVMGYGQLYKMPIKSNEKWLSFQEVFQLLLIIQSEAIQLKGQEIQKEIRVSSIVQKSSEKNSLKQV